MLLASSNAIVAHGTITSPNEVINTISGDPFPEDCVCVSIDEVVEPAALIPSPIPNNYGNVARVGDALGTHVAWPTHLVTVKEMVACINVIYMLIPYIYTSNICS